MKTMDAIYLSEAYWFQEGPGVRNWQFTLNGIKLLNVGNIEKSGTINLDKTDRHLSTEEATTKYKHFLCDEGDLVIASSGISFDSDGFLRTRGAFIEKKHLPLCINTSTIRFKSINQNSLSYLKHWLDSNEFRVQISKLVTGSAQLNFGPSHLKKLKIKLPPLAEQKRIAAILDKANDIKAKRELALAKLDELAECIFLEMFGNPLTNPMKWIEVKLNDICNAISDIDHKMPKAVEVGIPFISAKDLQDNDKLSFEKVKFISQKDFLHLSRKIKPSKGDIIYSRIGANLGKARLVDVDIDFVVSYSCCTIKPKLEVVNAKYLCKLLDLPATLEQAKKGTHSIAVPDLGIGEIKNFKIILPPLEMQKKYSDFLDKLKLQKNIISAYQSHTENLIKSLQNKAFTTGFNA